MNLDRDVDAMIAFGRYAIFVVSCDTNAAASHHTLDRVMSNNQSDLLQFPFQATPTIRYKLQQYSSLILGHKHHFLSLALAGQGDRFVKDTRSMRRSKCGRACLSEHDFYTFGKDNSHLHRLVKKTMALRSAIDVQSIARAA